MSAPRNAAAVIAIALVVTACRVATQSNELHMGDDTAESAQAIRPPPSTNEITIEVPDTGAPIEDASPDVIVDGGADGDADASVPPPCTPQTMHANATTTTCVADSFGVAGGTPSLGGYTLTRWADAAKYCKPGGSQRQGTMSLESVGGKLFMRFVLVIDGKTTTGTYELAPRTASTFTRTEVCDWTPFTPSVVVYYTATASEIMFVHDNGQERWARIPKALPTGANIDPGMASF